MCVQCEIKDLFRWENLFKKKERRKKQPKRNPFSETNPRKIIPCLPHSSPSSFLFISLSHQKKQNEFIPGIQGMRSLGNLQSKRIQRVHYQTWLVILYIYYIYRERGRVQHIIYLWVFLCIYRTQSLHVRRYHRPRNELTILLVSYYNPPVPHKWNDFQFLKSGLKRETNKKRGKYCYHFLLIVIYYV